MLKRGVLAVNDSGPLSLAVNDSLDISVGEENWINSSTNDRGKGMQEGLLHVCPTLKELKA